MPEICRICLQETVVPNFTEITNDVASIQIKHEILLCIPEVDLNLLRNPILCSTCLEALNAFYKFKKCCLHIEERIRSYMHSVTKPAEVTIFDVHKSYTFMGLPNANNVNPERSFIDDLNDLLDDALKYKEEQPSFNKVSTPFEPVAIKQEKFVTDQSSEVNLAPDAAVNNATENQTLPLDTAVNNATENEPCKPVRKNAKRNFMKCELCDYRTKYPHNLITHYNTKHDKNQQYSCESCSFKTAYKNSLLTHAIRHENQTALQCPTCSYKIMDANAFKKHTATHSNTNELVEPVKRKRNRLVEKRSLSCYKCDFRSQSSDVLRDHLQEEHNKKLYICPKCNKTTSTASNLKQHMVVHNGKHKNEAGSGGASYKCKVCNYKALSRHHYAGHMRKHKPPLQCTLCNFSTLLSKALLRHREKEHESKAIIADKSFACELCPFKAVSKSGLGNHMNNSHK